MLGYIHQWGCRSTLQIIPRISVSILERGPIIRTAKCQTAPVAVSAIQVQKEEAQVGSVSGRVYVAYIQAAGGWCLAITVVLGVLIGQGRLEAAKAAGGVVKRMAALDTIFFPSIYSHMYVYVHTYTSYHVYIDIHIMITYRFMNVAVHGCIRMYISLKYQGLCCALVQLPSDSHDSMTV